MNWIVGIALGLVAGLVLRYVVGPLILLALLSGIDKQR